MLVAPCGAVEDGAMIHGHKILVVAQNPTLACQLVTWLAPVTHELVVVTTFAAAKVHLATRPDVVITEVKLREYNGLHLALRAQSLGIPTLVIGTADGVFERQAQQLGASYLVESEIDEEALQARLRKMLDEGHAEALAHAWCEDVPTSTVAFVEDGVGTPPLGIAALGFGHRSFVVH
jgi:CheY-like chemotaxis protein